MSSDTRSPEQVAKDLLEQKLDRAARKYAARNNITMFQDGKLVPAENGSIQTATERTENYDAVVEMARKAHAEIIKLTADDLDAGIIELVAAEFV